MKLSVDQILRKAAAAAQNKHWAEAEQLYRMVLAQFPANQRAQEGLKSLAAIPPMRDMQAIFALCNQGSLEEAIVKASDLLATYPNSVDLHNITGIACARLGRIENAVASFNNVLRLAPDYADAYNNRAAALLDLGRPDEALASLDNALRFSPDHADAHYNRGNALKELKRLDEAVAS